MSNFAFIKEEWPQVFADCRRAEYYIAADPRTACIYARRGAESLVALLYHLRSLPEPYNPDLAARINAPDFRNLAGTTIVNKLTLIRRTGNTAVHGDRPIRPDASRRIVEELFHVVIWAAYRFSSVPDAVPTGQAFDQARASKSGPLSPGQLQALAAKIKDDEAAHQSSLDDLDAQLTESREQLAESQDRISALESQLAEYRAQVDAAQAAKTSADVHDYDEARTRADLIDADLRAAGWDPDAPQVREYPVTGMPNKSGTGRVDYVLWGAGGKPLAVVEAKATQYSSDKGQTQAVLYANALEDRFGTRPAIFYTNGFEIWLFDNWARPTAGDTGRGYPPRTVAGYYTAEELELLIARRTTRKLLAQAAINGEIAGADRPYQTRAIRSVDRAFDDWQRGALLVMATGTGKTRTAVALVDQLMKAGWVKRALFLADRRELVKQAVGAFKAHLPQVTTVNLVEDKEETGRVYVSTYPTMLGLTERFGPGAFDLVIIDEAHRSVYAKYGHLLRYFDGLRVGLTATPVDQIDRSTYRLFNLEPDVPTDAYDLPQAIADGFLVPYRGIATGTKILHEGLEYDRLTPEERERWDALDWGGWESDADAPDQVRQGDINRWLFNTETVDLVLAQLMRDGHKVAGGDRLGKTIIFAKNQKHADFILRRFNAVYPEYHGAFAAVITHNTPYAGSLIDDFKDPDHAPHVAISVDMLDTGIDVPELVNLVFFKEVHSKTKFWQMVGRGTRLRPDLYGPGQDKTDFLIFDFCGNLEYFGQNPPEASAPVQKSLSHRIFDARVALAVALGPGNGLGSGLRDLLCSYVGGMNRDNLLIRPHLRTVERFAERSAWDGLDAANPHDMDQVAELGGLPSSIRSTEDGGEQEQAKRFDLLILNGQLVVLDDDGGDPKALERLRAGVQQVAQDLLGKTNIPVVAAQAPLLEDLVDDSWWVDVTVEQLEAVRIRLRSLARLADRSRRSPVYTDFADEVIAPVEIEVAGMTPGVDFERFKQKARSYLREHADNLALRKLQRGRQITDSDIGELERLLIAAGGDESALERAQTESGGLGLFIRSLVGLDRSEAVALFARFLSGGGYSRDQIDFVELVIDELTENGSMAGSRLFQDPYTDFGSRGVLDMFPERTDITFIMDSLEQVTAAARPA
ncbi:DEAD/DEAH box helicase family protein [Brevibacterium sp. 50QC2O2]|uniref:DEAD/DEAH box helicase family protein n=1 Tax=Brevibacterium sp. 50QC2O2 TaxID=2968459 RepID=UPI00211BB187|nr:DEAD/DEAH box helicase family protein [Brevibacterium sp. 50QC2O2]